VINIITKQASSLNGIKAYGTIGVHNNAVGRTNGGVMLAQNGKDVSWDFWILSRQRHCQQPNEFC